MDNAFAVATVSELKIFDAVVSCVSIDVMNSFVLIKCPSEMAGHDDPMLGSVLI